jgi:hypothetical protein
MNPRDIITVDVPLFIRLLEYAREDAQTDMDLHDVADNIISLASSGKTLTMDDYVSIVGSQEELMKFEECKFELESLNKTRWQRQEKTARKNAIKQIWPSILK